MGAIALSYPPLLLLMTHHEKNAAESFTVALTLTLEGYGSAIAPIYAWAQHIASSQPS